METKRCTKCGEIKPIGLFHKSTKAKDGMNPHCKACRASSRLQNAEAIKQKKHIYFQNNKQKIYEYRKTVYHENLVNYFKNYYLKNKDRKIAYAHMYRDAHLDDVKRSQKTRYLSKRDRCIARAWLNSVGISVRIIPADVLLNIEILSRFKRKIRKVKEAK